MTEISASLIKELREETGAGMMDCKKALAENNGNKDASIDWLRKKGLAAAAKKSGRVAAEGLVTTAVKDGKGVVIEINSETDFVARNDKFQNLCINVANAALEGNSDIEKLKNQAYPRTGRNIEQEIAELVGVIGENIQLRRSASVTGTYVVSYVHNAIADNLGKIGVIVAFNAPDGKNDKVQTIGKQVAMHIAATAPQSLSPEDLDQNLLEREKAIYADQAKSSGKPEAIIAKMVDGRVRKFYSEVCLTEQAFIMDNEVTIAQFLKNNEKELGGSINISGFVRFKIGEGIEKKEENFAAEVAAVAGVR